MWITCTPAPVIIKARQRLASCREDIPGLKQQVAVERLADNTRSRHGRLHLIIPNQRDGVVQVVEEQCLCRDRRLLTVGVRKVGCAM